VPGPLGRRATNHQFEKLLKPTTHHDTFCINHNRQGRTSSSHGARSIPCWPAPSHPHRVEASFPEGPLQPAHFLRSRGCQGGRWVRFFLSLFPVCRLSVEAAAPKLWTQRLTISPNSLAPYERRVIELLRNSKDKRARKLAKKKACPRQPQQMGSSPKVPRANLVTAGYLQAIQGQGRGAAARHCRVPPCRTLNNFNECRTVSCED
jgi:hypothetical protein